MKYEGPLYGKIGRHYIPLRQSSKDFDDAEKIISLMKAEIERLRLALRPRQFEITIQQAIAEGRL